MIETLGMIPISSDKKSYIPIILSQNKIISFKIESYVFRYYAVIFYYVFLVTSPIEISNPPPLFLQK